MMMRRAFLGEVVSKKKSAGNAGFAWSLPRRTKKARQVVVGRTLEQAALAWPRIATLLRARESMQREVSESSSSRA